MDDIVERYKDSDNIVLVTHAGVAQAIECYFNGIPEDKDLERIALKTGEVRRYIGRKKNFSYITVMSTENYLEGVLTLNESLKKN